MSLEALVHESLDNAKDNGYDVLLAGPAFDIAVDLLEYDAQFEGHWVGQIIPHVESWQQKQGVTS